MNATDTTYEDPRDASYPATGEMLVWRCNGETRYSKLYRPTAEVLGWDKPRTDGEDGEVFAVGSRFGGFSYVVVKTTGRKLTKATGSDLYGTRCQVAMNLGQDSYASDRELVPAWVVA